MAYMVPSIPQRRYSWFDRDPSTCCCVAWSCCTCAWSCCTCACRAMLKSLMIRFSSTNFWFSIVRNICVTGLLGYSGVTAGGGTKAAGCCWGCNGAGVTTAAGCLLGAGGWEGATAACTGWGAGTWGVGADAEGAAAGASGRTEAAVGARAGAGVWAGADMWLGPGAGAGAWDGVAGGLFSGVLLSLTTPTHWTKLISCPLRGPLSSATAFCASSTF